MVEAPAQPSADGQVVTQTSSDARSEQLQELPYIEASPEGIDQIMLGDAASKLTGVAASSSSHDSTDTPDLEPDRTL